MSHAQVRFFGLCIPIIASFFTGNPAAAQSTYSWNTTTTNTAWLNPPTWSGGTPTGVFPGLSSNLSLPNGHARDTAVFGTFASAIGTNGVGIDFASANTQLGVGAIQLISGTGGNLRIGNSSSTNGDIFLNSTTVSGVPNVVLANTSGSRDLTLDNTPSGAGSQTMRLAIGTELTSVFLVTSGGSIIANSVIFESDFGAGFIVQGGGTVVLGGANLFNGAVAITGGSTLSVSQDTNFGNAPTIGSPGKIVLNDGVLNVTAGFTLTPFRGVALGPTSGTGNGTINVASGQTLVYGGIIANNGGTGSFIKTGTGTLTLNGVNTYSGTTTINAGTLAIGSAGSLAAASAVTVNNSGNLSGIGNVNGTVTIASGGILTPGVSGVGTLTLRGNTSLNSSGRLAISLAAPGTSSRVSVLGAATTVNFAVGSILDLTRLSGFGAAGNYSVLTMPTGSGGNVRVGGTPTTNNQVLGMFVQGTGASGDVTIITSGFTLATGDTFILRRTGDAVVLSFTPVPEPVTVLGISTSVLGLWAVARRRGKQRGHHTTV